MTKNIEETTACRRSARSQRIDAVCWGLFFIWIGCILMVKGMPRGVGSFGVGAIVLGGAVVRHFLHVTVSTFWIIIGTVFVLAGAGEMLALDLPLLPAALIICGMLLLFHTRSKRRRRRHRR
ncbi:MAG: hypothetical protein WC956_06665 [bacterium]